MSAASRPPRKGILLCYPFSEKRLLSWGCPVFEQPKLEGERCRVALLAGAPIFLSSTEEVIFSVPHINEEIARRPALMEFLQTHELDGELYRHGMSFNEIHSRVSRRTNLHPDYQSLELHIFDCKPLAEPSLPQDARLRRLAPLPLDGPLARVPTEAIPPEEVMPRLLTHIADGYEGIIVRHPFAPYVEKRSTQVMKFKPTRCDHYRVVGVQEEISQEGIPKGTLGALVVHPPGEPFATFAVGSGFTQAQRAVLWQERDTLPGRLIEVRYQALHQSGRPQFGVFVKLLPRGRHE